MCILEQKASDNQYLHKDFHGALCYAIKYLDDNFGEEITFWGGGADTRNAINRRTPRDVKKHVLELLEIFSPGGGYVWKTVHNILPDVPPENIVAMFEAVDDYNNQY